MATESTRQESGARTETMTRPYPPSWVDQLIGWIERLPGSPWPFYGVLLLASIVVNNGLQWLDGTLPPGTLDRLAITDALLPIYFLALIHYLNAVARQALAAFRPALTIDDSAYSRLRYELTTIPARMGLVVVGIGAALGMLTILENPARFGIVASTSVVTLIYNVILTSFFWAMIPASLYHTIRQLRLVSQLHRRATHIDLFQPAPAYAFSALTARTGIGLFFFSFYFIAQNPTPVLDAALRVSDPAVISVVAVMVLVGSASFVLPLHGMHRRLVAEKERLTAEANRHLVAMIAKLHQRVDSDQLANMDDVNKAIASLLIEREVLGKISTWPWESATLRGFISAVVLPIVLWLITALLGRVI